MMAWPFARCFTPYGTWPSLGLPSGVHLLQGLFADTLKDGAKGPFALIRSDSDIYSSVYETLHHLYPRLSIGGYIVFDDYKIPEAAQAIHDYRAHHQIHSPIWGINKSVIPKDGPFETFDVMAFWRKRADEGGRGRNEAAAVESEAALLGGFASAFPKRRTQPWACAGRAHRPVANSHRQRIRHDIYLHALGEPRPVAPPVDECHHSLVQ